MPSNHPWPSTLFCLAWLTIAGATALSADDEPVATKQVQVSFVAETKQPRELMGRVLVKAADGGLLVEGRDGRLWTITPDRLKSVVEQDEPFAPLDRTELAQALVAELKLAKILGDYEILETEHYLIVAKTSRAYAEWCGHVLERLFVAFTEFAKSQGIATTPPKMPLPVIVFANQTQFAGFATTDAGSLSAKGQGYYSITSNRVVLYDLTTAKGQPPLRNRSDVVKRLRASTSNVATVVHEATHQIAFNIGVHRRYADNPVWLTEGLAMYFEAADFLDDDDLGLGRSNATRLKRLQEMLRGQRLKPLDTLLRDDKRFGQAVSAPDAYAEAWGLTYLLLKNRPTDFASYLKRLAEKPQLVWDTPTDRLAEFETVFGAPQSHEPSLKRLAIGSTK